MSAVLCKCFLHPIQCMEPTRNSSLLIKTADCMEEEEEERLATVQLLDVVGLPLADFSNEFIVNERNARSLQL